MEIDLNDRVTKTPFDIILPAQDTEHLDKAVVESTLLRLITNQSRDSVPMDKKSNPTFDSLAVQTPFASISPDERSAQDKFKKDFLICNINLFYLGKKNLKYKKKMKK